MTKKTNHSAELSAFDDRLREKHGPILVGIDEAGRGCETDDAEILTRLGWQRCHSLTTSDEVLSLTGEGLLVWQQIKHVIVKECKDVVIQEISHPNGLSIRVTPDHCFDVLRKPRESKRMTQRTLTYIGQGEFLPHDLLPRTGVWEGQNGHEGVYPFMRPAGEYRDANGHMKPIASDSYIPANEWVSFLGLYLSTGCCIPRDLDIYRVRIPTPAPCNVDRVQNLFDRLPFDFTASNEGYECRDAGLWLYLTELGDCYDRRVPLFLKKMPAENIGVFLDWFFLWDGTLSGYNEGMRSRLGSYSGPKRKPILQMFTASPQLRDNIDELVIKSGMICHTLETCSNGEMLGVSKVKHGATLYGIALTRDAGDTSFKWMKRRSSLYSGDVFCVRLADHHNFCVRRNGRSYFTGNSWAGPISAGAVILPAGAQIPGLDDSKKMTRESREAAAVRIKEVALGWAVAFVGVDEINAVETTPMNWANGEVMRRAAEGALVMLRSLQPGAEADLYVLDQFSQRDRSPASCLEPYVMASKMDGTSLSVAAASVLAKVGRDALMVELHEKYPEYGLDVNKGYVRQDHVDAVIAHGRKPALHRMSYQVAGVNKPKRVGILELLELEELEENEHLEKIT